MAVLFQRHYAGGLYTDFEPDQPEYFRHGPPIGAFLDGRVLNLPGFDPITSATQVKPTKGRVPDIITVRTIRVCSQRFKDFVEAWEPGLHFFEPFTLKRKSGEDLGPHYKYGIGQDIDCLLTERLGEYFDSYVSQEGATIHKFVSFRAIGKAGSAELYPDKFNNPPIEISGPAVAGAHLWTMGLLGGGGCDEPMLMSDAMYAAYRKEKFRELSYSCKAHEIDRPWRAEENMGPMLERWRKRERMIAEHWPKFPPRRGHAVAAG